MGDKRSYWVWLQHALGAGSTKPSRILEMHESLEEFYESGRQGWLLDGIFTPRELENLDSYTLDQAEAQLEFTEKLGQQVLCPEDAGYPALLRQTVSPPCALYVKGQLPPEEALCIAMVGTRKASPAGLSAANSIAYSLAKQGAVVVSGGALGIDSACHTGALRAGGKTVCVLGCGIDYNYLMKNASLREAVSHSGALVSEYPPNTPASANSFPIRNRIISGLSAGTVVVEAAAKSGSLITVGFALEQGRDVFAVPGAVTSLVSQGTNSLIREGAKPVTCAEDILEEYPSFFPRCRREERCPAVLPPDPPEEEPAPLPVPQLSPEGEALYRALGREPAHLSQLAAQAGLSMGAALGAVTELELGGLVHSYSGRRYSRG